MRLELDSGIAEFYKIGAAVTFIRHGDEVRVVEQSSLPVGVVCRTESAEDHHRNWKTVILW